MKYIDFVNNLAEDLREEFEKRNRVVEVELVNVEKPWGTEIGIKVSDGRRIEPVFYPKDEYEYHEAGRDYFSMLERFANRLERTLDDAHEHFSFDLNSLKDSITMQLVNTERSQMYLKNKPHRDVEDLSIIYRLNMGMNDNEWGSIVVTFEMMQQLGFDEEGIYQFAMERAPANMPYEIKSMEQVLNEMMPGFDAKETDNSLYVVTNESRNLGASVLMYPHILEQCAAVMNGDFYVIPSSVHECLLHPDNNQIDYKELKAMVKEVNDTQVSQEDLLSYNVYHYDWKEKVFELAEKYEARMKVKQSIRDNLEAKKHEVSRTGYLRRNQDIGDRRVRGGSLCL